MKTIHKVGFEFFDSNESAYHFAINCGLNLVLYNGDISDIPDKLAHDLCELHPNCLEYYAIAMATLYKGYSRILRGGTENPRLAISSLKGKRDTDKEFVVIWKLTEE